jgi:hypothetical protein
METTDIREIPFAPGYSVNTQGCVYSYRRSSQGCHQLQPRRKQDGYGRVMLSINNSPKEFPISQLVLRVFVGDPPSSDHTADHINRDRTDDRLENLRWATRSQQRENQDRKERHYCRPVRGVMRDGTTRDFESAQDAANYLAKTYSFAYLTLYENVKRACRAFSEVYGFKWSYVVPPDLGISKEIPETNYHVTTTGYIIGYREKISRGSLSADGYRKIKIANKCYGVHRLVASAFIPNPMNLPCVNHKNGIKDDNNVGNLEWCTNADNVLHSYALRKESKRQKLGTGS